MAALNWMPNGEAVVASDAGDQLVQFRTHAESDDRYFGVRPTRNRSGLDKQILCLLTV
jgi:hypothetical protein